jgi:hypothetical protein
VWARSGGLTGEEADDDPDGSVEGRDRRNVERAVQCDRNVDVFGPRVRPLLVRRATRGVSRESLGVGSKRGLQTYATQVQPKGDGQNAASNESVQAVMVDRARTKLPRRADDTPVDNKELISVTSKERLRFRTYQRTEAVKNDRI